MRGKKRARKISFSTFRIHDRNEKFVLQNCAGYLQGILRFRPELDQETVDFLEWVIGSDIQLVLHSVVEASRPDIRERYEDDSDEDEASHCVMSLFRRLSRMARRDTMSLILDLLEKRREFLEYSSPCGIERKLSELQEMFKLTDQEVEFCTFLYVITMWNEPEAFFVSHLDCHLLSHKSYLASFLQLRTSELDRILDGVLWRIGFFELERYTFVMTQEFIEFFKRGQGQALSRSFYKRITGQPIPLSCHMVDGNEVEHVLNLLKVKPKTSTHILLYGPPGTGKTSFAKGLIHTIGQNGYEIVRDEKNTSSRRRAAIIACCNMTKEMDDAIIVVDEADNLLNTQISWTERGETQDKGWFNELMEEPGLRMIWITNDIGAIEESVLRRFAFSIHFKAFTRAQRIKLWDSILRRNRVKNLFTKEEIMDLARKYWVNAGVIDLAVKKALEISSEEEEKLKGDILRYLETYVTLVNEGRKPIRKEIIEKNYSLAGLNIEGNLATVMEQIAEFDRHLRAPEGDQILHMNLLFYGPPGTGKSELARYIANSLDRELICKRASDIIDMYIGETEQHIKSAFDEAEAEEAVLVFDEVDSFLGTREKAVRSWEISQVNEFLTQMERFNGILICTTNRLQDLDNASIRRFNHKIGFRYLTSEGKVIFYERLLAPLTKDEMSKDDKTKIATIPDLSPGDYSVVRDKFCFMRAGQISHAVLIAALQEESRVKDVHKRHKPIGF